jgi:hypothetical protein
MNRSTCGLVLAAAIAVRIVSVFGQAPEKQRQGFLSILKKGQAAHVKDIAGRFEITVMEGPEGIMPHKVITVEDDYLVFEDAARLIATRIPIFSIKAITTLKQPKE